MMHSPPPEQSESFWHASSPEHDAWHVAPTNPAQHFIPLAQFDEALHEAPDAAPPWDGVVPLADDIGHALAVNW